MSKIFYVGFFFFATSTIAFIIAILNPYWIIKANPNYRGIFEICEKVTNNDFSELRTCAYILLNPNSPEVATYRTGEFGILLCRPICAPPSAKQHYDIIYTACDSF